MTEVTNPVRCKERFFTVESGQTQEKGIREPVDSPSLEVLTNLLVVAKDNLLS